MEDRGRGWGDTPQPRKVWSHRKLGEAREGSSLEHLEGVWSFEYPDFRLWASRAMR